MPDTSPIVLFTYNRPEHAAATLEALAANALAAQSDLTIYCDGPRTPEDEPKVKEVRAVAHATSGFRSVRVVERDENFGLARSVITGVNDALAVSETVIVLEDDLVTSPYFLEYMNQGLRKYANDSRVISICGYRFPVDGDLPDTFFLPGAFCWGWATWRRAWSLFEHDASALMTRLIKEDRIYDFDFRGSDPLTQILQRTANGDKRADSWATRWMGSACVEGKFTLYPGRSLVRNIGFDRSGRHAGASTRFDSPMADAMPVLGDAPVPAPESVFQQHWDLFARWRAGGNRRIRWYYRVSKFLPETGRKRLYTSIIKRSLYRNAAPVPNATV